MLHHVAAVGIVLHRGDDRRELTLSAFQAVHDFSLRLGVVRDLAGRRVIAHDPSFGRVDTKHTPGGIVASKDAIPPGVSEKGGCHVPSDDVPHLREDDLGGVRRARRLRARNSAGIPVVQRHTRSRRHAVRSVDAGQVLLPAVREVTRVGDFLPGVPRLPVVGARARVSTTDIAEDQRCTRAH